MNKYVMAVLAGVLAVSCYDDKGNYDYDESVADVAVTLDPSYGVKKEKSEFSYTITPNIKIDEAYRKNLSYEWYMNTRYANQKGDLVSTEPVYTVTLDPNDPDMPQTLYIRLYVKDELTGAVSLATTTLEVVNPYTYAWMVLHETDGHAELGAVEYLGGTILVTPDAYTKDHGSSMTGKPLSLFCRQDANYNYGGWLFESPSQLYVNTTNPDESGQVNTANGFAIAGKWIDILHSQQRNAYFDIATATFSAGNYGALMNSKGRIFLQTGYSQVMYLMSQGADVTGDYYISKMAVGPQAGVGFDEMGHRFLNLSLQNADSWMTPAPAAEPAFAGDITLIPRHDDNAYDPSRIPEDQKIVSIVTGYHYGKSGIAPWQRYTIYGYTVNGGGNQSYVYVFQCRGLTGSDPAMPYFYSFVTPDGVDENTLMTTGNSFNNLLFYAVGNKIYRLDVSSGNSTLIYQHEDPEATVAALKMACEGYCYSDATDEIGTEEYGMPYCRCLGIGFNLPDNTGEFVVLQLGTNGNLMEDEAKYPSVQIHKGFGPIKSIAFM